MEFLIGRSLANNITNLLPRPVGRRGSSRRRAATGRAARAGAGRRAGQRRAGRLAACFIDSLATLQIPAIGYGLRYDYGIFRQELARRLPGRAAGQLADAGPTRGRSPGRARRCTVPLGIARSSVHGGADRRPPRPADAACSACPTTARSSATAGRRSTPCGCGRPRRRTSSTSASSAAATSSAPSPTRCSPSRVTRVLYPDDSTPRGRSLRFLQEYFLVRCSLADIVARFRRRGNDWPALPDKVAIQLNDTHPAMAVPELMRILLDEAKLGWDEAWDLTVRTLAYTNHTLLPEALEKWPVELFEALLPAAPGDRLRDQPPLPRRRAGEATPATRRGSPAMSLIEEGPDRKVRMANLAIVGTHSTNGVAAIHSELLRTTTVPDFAELFPERFNNKTNGVTPRRWLLLANPDLATLLTEAIGDGWVTDLAQLRKARRRWPTTPAFREKFLAAKRAAKARFVDWLKADGRASPSTPTRSSTCQIKRIHEYKRQLLNALQVRRLVQPAARRTRSSTCRRGRSCSPARRPRRTTSPRSSSS